MSTNAAIVCYSRTGTTRKLAALLADRLSVPIEEIGCARFRPGGLRYLAAGYHSVRGNLPRIEAPTIDLSGFDLALLGTPVWTSHPSLPMRAFLAMNPTLPERVAVFMTYGGHSPAETAIAELTDLLAVPPVATLAVSQNDLRQDKCQAAIDRFVRDLDKSPTECV